MLDYFSLKPGSKSYKLLSMLECASRMLPKVLLLTTFLTLILLLMHIGLHYNQVTSDLPTPVYQPTAQNDEVTSFFVPETSSAKPTTNRPIKPPSKGMPCREVQERFPDSIPPVVHWTTKDGRVHKNLINTVKSWLQLSSASRNSSVKWYYMHWDDAQISRLVTKYYPVLSKSYAKLANGLERSDIGRLVVLHHVGGLYVDLDVELRRDPSSLLTSQSELPDGELGNSFNNCRTALWSQEPLEHAEFIFNRRWLLSNAVMMSRANHSFLNYVLSTWPSWYETNWSKKRRAIGDAVYVTGPIMLHSFYEKYAALKNTDRPEDLCDGMVAEPDAFQPIMDNGFIWHTLKRKCVNIEKLSESKQELCRQMICANFKNRPVPSTSYTLHHFLHLSYKAMKLDDSECILRLLPILKCKI